MRMLLSIFAVHIIFSFFSFHSCANEIWKITSLNWQPYSGAELTEQGTVFQILRQKLKSAGITLEIEFLPWNRAKEMARNIKYIGYCPAWPEEVGAGFIASPPIEYSIIAAITKNKKMLYTTLDELFQQHKVGLVKTYTYPTNIDRIAQKYKNQTTWVPDEEALVKMLENNRFDVAITDPRVIQYYAAKLHINNVITLIELERKPLVLAIRDDKDGRKRLTLLRKVLK